MVLGEDKETLIKKDKEEESLFWKVRFSYIFWTIGVLCELFYSVLFFSVPVRFIRDVFSFSLIDVGFNFMSLFICAFSVVPLFFFIYPLIRSDFLERIFPFLHIVVYFSFLFTIFRNVYVRIFFHSVTLIFLFMYCDLRLFSLRSGLQTRFLLCQFFGLFCTSFVRYYGYSMLPFYNDEWVFSSLFLCFGFLCVLYFVNEEILFSTCSSGQISEDLLHHPHQHSILMFSWDRFNLRETQRQQKQHKRKNNKNKNTEEQEQDPSYWKDLREEQQNKDRLFYDFVCSLFCLSHQKERLLLPFMNINTQQQQQQQTFRNVAKEVWRKTLLPSSLLGLFKGIYATIWALGFAPLLFFLHRFTCNPSFISSTFNFFPFTRFGAISLICNFAGLLFVVFGYKWFQSPLCYWILFSPSFVLFHVFGAPPFMHRNFVFSVVGYLSGCVLLMCLPSLLHFFLIEKRSIHFRGGMGFSSLLYLAFFFFEVCAVLYSYFLPHSLGAIFDGRIWLIMCIAYSALTLSYSLMFFLRLGMEAFRKNKNKKRQGIKERIYTFLFPHRNITSLGSFTQNFVSPIPYGAKILLFGVVFVCLFVCFWMFLIIEVRLFDRMEQKEGAYCSFDDRIRVGEWNIQDGYSMKEVNNGREMKKMLNEHKIDYLGTSESTTALYSFFGYQDILSYLQMTTKNLLFLVGGLNYGSASFGNGFLSCQRPLKSSLTELRSHVEMREAILSSSVVVNHTVIEFRVTHLTNYAESGKYAKYGNSGLLQIEEVLEEFCGAETENIILMGDLNVHPNEKVYNIIKDFGFIDSYYEVHGTHNATHIHGEILDYIWYKGPNLVPVHSNIVPSQTVSDHYLMYTDFKVI